MIQNNLPDNARVWIYTGLRKFNSTEVQELRQLIRDFVEQWTSHKMDVDGWGDLVYNRFIVLMANEEQVSLGGCSIDSSTSFIKTLEKKFNTKFFDRWQIVYRAGDEICSASREEFLSLLQQGEVNEQTTVFNNLIKTKGEMNLLWEVPYGKSWMAKAEPNSSSFSLSL